MNLQELYQKNKKKHLLKEVTVTGTTAAFVGTSGDIIDTKLAGPFHPKLNGLKKQLEKQIENDKLKKDYTRRETPIISKDFEELDWKYEYDEYVKEDNSKFKSNSETEMQLVDLDIKYDDIIDKTEENKKFINDTNDWKSIYDLRKY